jgi:hypothetical protein
MAPTSVDLSGGRTLHLRELQRQEVDDPDLRYLANLLSSDDMGTVYIAAEESPAIQIGSFWHTPELFPAFTTLIEWEPAYDRYDLRKDIRHESQHQQGQPQMVFANDTRCLHVDMPRISIEPQRTLRLREMQRHEQSPDVREFSELIGELGLDSVFVAVDEDEDQDELVDVFVGSLFQLTRLIRRDNHAKVYSVKDWLHPASQRVLEARAYSFEGLSSKQRKYRQRNMVRLSKRSVLKEQMFGHTIVLYTVNPEEHQQSRADPLQPTSESQVTDGDCQSIDKRAKTKSEAQNEKARLKQRTRRITRREEKRATLELETRLNTGTELEPATKTKATPSPEERSMNHFRELFRLNSLTHYLTAMSLVMVKPASKERLAAIIMVKKQEVAEFARYQAKLAKLLERKMTEFEAISNMWVQSDCRDDTLYSLYRKWNDDCIVLRDCERLMHKILHISRRALFLAEQRFRALTSAQDAYVKAYMVVVQQPQKPVMGSIEIFDALEQATLPISSTAEQVRAARVREEKAKALWSRYYEMSQKPLNLGDMEMP